MVEKKPLLLLEPIPFVKPESWMTLDRKARVMDVTVPESFSYLESVRTSPEWAYLREPASKTPLSNFSAKLAKLYGPSGVGKERVYRLLSSGSLHDKILLLSLDSYYGPFGKAVGGIPIVGNNYDHPNSLDLGLFKHHLNLLQQGYSVRVPRYDFTTHSRQEGFLVVEPKEIILAAGIMSAHVLQDVKADLNIAVVAPLKTALSRRVRRDVRDRGRRLDQCLDQIEATVKPGFYQFVEPYLRPGPDKLIIDNSLEVDDPDHTNEGLKVEEIFSRVGSLL